MSTIPVTVQIPGDAEAPVIADFVEHALRAAYVDRVNLAVLAADTWNVPGVYILLAGNGSNQVYVGQARQMKRRLMQHDSKEKLPWNRAILVKRDTTDGFNTAEIGYLEGRVAAELSTVASLSIVQGQTSGDETLPKHMMISLDSFVKTILASLRLAGVSLERRPVEIAEPSIEENAVLGVSAELSQVKMPHLVSNGLIEAGEKLYLSQGGVERTATVTAEGEIVVEGVAYTSPSSAAANALRYQSANGWITWHVGSADGPFLDHFRRIWLARQNERNAHG